MQKIFMNINKRTFLSNSKLPNNDELAVMFGVGRSSVREALKELQTLGIVTLKHGEGTYVCSFPSIENGPMRYLAETRRMIEVYAAERALAEATDAQLQALQEPFNLMETHYEDDVAYIYYDRKFHYQIAELTKNPMITSILSSIEVLFASMQSTIIGLKGQKRKAHNEHKAILDGLLQRDRTKTLQAINHHYDRMLDGWIEELKRSSQ